MICTHWQQQMGLEPCVGPGEIAARTAMGHRRRSRGAWRCPQRVPGREGRGGDVDWVRIQSGEKKGKNRRQRPNIPNKTTTKAIEQSTNILDRNVKD